MQISVSREGKKNIYIRAGFFNNLTASTASTASTVFFFSKKISREVNIKTRSAAIAFFFLLLLSFPFALSIVPFLVLF